jgi:hypothetical protein
LVEKRSVQEAEKREKKARKAAELRHLKAQQKAAGFAGQGFELESSMTRKTISAFDVTGPALTESI